MRVTVVVVPLVGGEALRACVGALSDAHDVELLVCATDAAEEVEGARLLPAGESGSVPRLRAAAAEACTTEVVAFLEDTSRPGVGWLDTLRRVFEDGVVGAAGGSVALDAQLGARARALAYLEYGAYLRPPTGPVNARSLPGNGFALRREALQSCRDAWADGLREADLAPLLADKGWRVVRHPRLTVTYVHEDGNLARLSTRFHHGRIYGAHRFPRKALASRLAMALSCPGVPFVLALRAWGDAKADARRSVLALPWVFVYAAAWSIGEFVGYVAGAGASEDAWR